MNKPYRVSIIINKPAKTSLVKVDITKMYQIFINLLDNSEFHNS